MPISAGTVTAAGNDEATPRPIPMTLDQSNACEGTNITAALTTQQMVLAKMGGHAEVTTPENIAHAMRPSDMAYGRARTWRSAHKVSVMANLNVALARCRSLAAARALTVQKFEVMIAIVSSPSCRC